MSDTSSPQSAAVAAFRALHATGCFVLPNPWDAGTAHALRRMGFKALATTSAGAAFSRGLPDTRDVHCVDDVLAHVRGIVAATPLPVNADFQSGYAADAEGVAANVAKCVATGVAGLSIEDSDDSNMALRDRRLSVERLRAARAAIDASGAGVVLTGRCESWLAGDATPLATSLDRLVAYADAGADCLYAPGVRDPREIAEIVRAVAPKPVNVLMSSPVPGLTLARLADLGVRRVSVGSALARVAWGAFLRAGRSIAETGTFDALGDAAPFPELNELFRGRG